jgi:hypothetical protein
MARSCRSAEVLFQLAYDAPCTWAPVDRSIPSWTLLPLPILKPRPHGPFREVCEQAAHKISNAVEAAYRRGDLLEKRQQLMQAWSDYVHSA